MKSLHPSQDHLRELTPKEKIGKSCEINKERSGYGRVLCRMKVKYEDTSEPGKYYCCDHYPIRL